jgi:hypothetical protein
MGPRPVKVKPLKLNHLLLEFENGERRIFDVSPFLPNGIFQELNDQKLFCQARLVFDAVEWPNGADICPELLYEQSIPAAETAADEEPDYPT